MVWTGNRGAGGGAQGGLAQVQGADGGSRQGMQSAIPCLLSMVDRVVPLLHLCDEGVSGLGPGRALARHLSSAQRVLGYSTTSLESCHA